MIAFLRSPRDRFFEILTALHFVDNKQPHDTKDKAWKMRPVIKHLNNSFSHAMSPTAQQAIDEHMVKFKGQHAMKQYMPMKPIKRGFKMWCRNDSATGYLFQFDMNGGKQESNVGSLGENVITQLSRSLVGTNMRLFSDNFFPSPPLIHKLKQKKICCGTVQQNRKGMPKDLKKDKDMARGEINRRKSQGLHLVKWMDIKGVVLLSPIDSCVSTVNVKRRVKGQKEKVTVPCPVIVKAYNQGMKGTDVADQLKVTYEIGRRYPQKFYLCLFFDLIDIGFVNAFIVKTKMIKENFPRSRRLKTLKDFKHSVIMDLMGSFSCRKRLKKSSSLRLPMQNSGEYHITRVSIKETGRCKLCTKSKIYSCTFICCNSCNLYLCQTSKKDCFAEWHSGVQE